MSLSICCATSEPSRAAVALEPLRRVAEEIVVAVDVSGGERDLTPLGGVADRVFEIELDTFPEPAMAWLHGRCTGEWIMRIDDDELADGRLLEALPELTRARDVVQYWLARRWLHPDEHGWLDERPWFPDFQGRLVRNDAQLWFPGLCHSSVVLVRPARYLDVGLYHFAHLLSSREERERKVARYLAVAAALRETGADGELPDYYVPERRPGARRGEVDGRDREAVARALTRLRGRGGGERRARWVVGGRRHGGVRQGLGRGHRRRGGGEGQAPRARRLPRSEVRASWAAREIPASAYRARIEPVDVYRRMVSGDDRPFRVRVRNEGGERWPGGEGRTPLIRVAYRWLTAAGEVFDPEGIRTALPRPLGPGEECVVAMNVIAPAVAGRYLLAPDLVHEHVRWFGCEARPVAMAVVVSDPGEAPLAEEAQPETERAAAVGAARG